MGITLKFAFYGFSYLLEVTFLSLLFKKNSYRNHFFSGNIRSNGNALILSHRVLFNFVTFRTLYDILSPFLRQVFYHAYHKAVRFVFGNSFLLWYMERISHKSSVPYPVSTIPFLSSNGFEMLHITSFQPFGTTERICKKVSLVILLYIDKIYLSTVFLHFCKIFKQAHRRQQIIDGELILYRHNPPFDTENAIILF